MTNCVAGGYNLDMKVAQIKYFAEVVGLGVPVEVALRYTVHKHNQAVYMPKYNLDGVLKLHKIRIYMGDIEEGTRSLETLVVHEMIHAWQEENKLTKGKFHNKHFRIKARDLEMRLGWPVESIYNPELDQT